MKLVVAEVKFTADTFITRRHETVGGLFFTRASISSSRPSAKARDFLGPERT